MLTFSDTHVIIYLTLFLTCYSYFVNFSHSLPQSFNNHCIVTKMLKYFTIFYLDYKIIKKKINLILKINIHSPIGVAEKQIAV